MTRREPLREDAIKYWPRHERPRERLLKHGPESLSDAELLAIFLRTGVSGRSAVDLARTLRRPIFGPVPAPLLRLVVGEMADTLLGGQRAAPEVARMHGFVWKHPSLGPALASLLGAKARA